MTRGVPLPELKALLLQAVDKSDPEGGLRDDEVLFGPESRLALDSLDALEVAMAIQERYGVRMTDSKQTRRAMASLANLARHLEQRRR